MRRVVVGVDGSSGADAALEWAVHEAGVWHAPLLMVHACEMSPVVASGPFAASAIAAGALEDEAQEIVQLALGTARLIDPSVTTRAAVLSGKVATSLIETTRDGDLLVVGRRGRSALRSLILGSVSQHSIDHARVAVAVVPPSRPQPDTDEAATRCDRYVLVGIDGSAGSDIALAWAVAEARRRGIRVQALHAWQQPAMMTAGGRSIAYPDPDLSSAAQSVAQEAIGRCHRLGIGDAGRVQSSVVQFDPEVALVGASNHAELLVVGSRGRGALAGMFSGSISQAMARRAHCPTVVVPMVSDSGHRSGS